MFLSLSFLRNVITFCLFLWANIALAELSGSVNVDNEFRIYLSTDDSTQGTLLATGNRWPTTYDFTTQLTAGQDYYLHIHANDTGGPAGFLGAFTLNSSDHLFANGTTEILTNTSEWSVSNSGWGGYTSPTDYGANGTSPWGRRSGVDDAARWIWSSDNNNDNEAFFTTKITSINACRLQTTLTASGIKLGRGGSTHRIVNTTDAESIYEAWVQDGTPASGMVGNGSYNLTTAATSQVDRLDFGGYDRNYSGTLAYPFDPDSLNTNRHTDFLVQATGTIALPAGDYTIFVRSDDGFMLKLESVSGDNVVFSKFGKSNAGASNELRYERPTGDSRTGGSFTLSQPSVFTINTLFFERAGGDWMEVGIVNTLTSSTNSNDYEVFKHGAMNGKLNFSSCVAPPAAPELVAEYRFEDDAYNGTIDEVKDTSGNDHHGRVVRNSSMQTGTPALSGNPGTCSYVEQDNGTVKITGLPVDTSTTGAKTTVTFWMKWDGTDNVNPMGWNRHDLWLVNGRLGFSTWNNNDIFYTSSSGLANQWVHIAAEFTNGNVSRNKIYINGVLQTMSQYRSPKNSSAYVNGELRIGGVANSSNFDFHGLIDEFRVYKGELDASQIQTIMAERHPCVARNVHHYRLIHDGEGLTCDSEEVIIKACMDSACSQLSADPISIQLLGNGAVKSSLTFTGSGRSSFNHTMAESISLSLANASMNADNSVQCDSGSGSSCTMTFSDAGFRFLNGNSTTMPNQTAGITFPNSLAVQAVQSNDGVCSGMFTGSKSIQMSYEPVTPNANSRLNFTLGLSSLAPHPSQSNVTLLFDAQSRAILPAMLYEDAGLIRLRASLQENGVTVSGTSNSFWVKPARFEITAQTGAGELNGNNATSNVSHPAGEPFELQIRAVNQQGQTTPNYQAGRPQLKLTRVAPTVNGSSEGNLVYASGKSLTTALSASFQNADVPAFSLGVSTFNQAHYSEVGVVSLQARDANYGNQGLSVTSLAGTIGRFTPHHFTQTVADAGMLQARCDTQVAFHSYLGQMNGTRGAIEYFNAPVLEITAYNKLGSVTKNYYQDMQGSLNDFMKLDASDISIIAPTADSAAQDSDNQPISVTAQLNTGTLSQTNLTPSATGAALPRGVLHYQFSSLDHFAYERNAKTMISPFTAQLQFGVREIVDSDNVLANSMQSTSPSGIQMRFGRMMVENSFGPETHNLPQALKLEYYRNGRFVSASDDSCTPYYTSNFVLSDISLNPLLTQIIGTNGHFSQGEAKDIEFGFIGTPQQGQMGVEYDAPDWLEFDWDGDGQYDDNPKGVSTFGIFRGHDRLLNWREVYE